MALTTSEEIQKQLTVIFGFNGRLGFEVGNIIGIGKLSAQHTELLITQSLQFLNAYNAMLRDYAGCELYSIEFELENMDLKQHLNIMPKSMLFIPGEYKDCTTLLLLLSQQMSLLDNKKSKQAVDDLGKLYFEVEEALERPELNQENKKEILTKFAHRFALKLQGQVIDGKWNRKLVGLKEESNEEKFEKYVTIHLKKNIRWDRNKELEPKNPRFSTSRLKLNKNDEFLFMKHQILPSTAINIAQQTFRLSSNLLQIANTGTVDDLQNQLLIVILNGFLTYSKNETQLISIDDFKLKFYEFLTQLQKNMQNFFKISYKFCRQGEIYTLDELIENYGTLFPNGSDMEQLILFQLAQITIIHMKKTNYVSQDKIRTIECQSSVLYIEENMKMVINSINHTIPLYFKHYLLLLYAQKLVELLYIDFSTQRKPVMALGYKYLEKFAAYLRNQIEFMSIFDTSTQNNREISQDQVYLEFKKIAQDAIEPFINDVNIEIEDLMGFVEIMMKDIPEAEPHINKLLHFRKDIEFLWGLMLRSSSLNRFLKDFSEENSFDPSQFSQNFVNFLRKRLGGFEIQWKDHILSWIEEFGQIFQPKYLEDFENKIIWSKQKIVQSFIQHIDSHIEQELSLEGFKIPLKNYVDKYAMNINARNILEIYKSYVMSLDFRDQFPDFIRQTFIKVIESLDRDFPALICSHYLGEIPPNASLFKNDEITKKQLILNSLSKPGENGKQNQDFKEIFLKKSYYEFILQIQMKYFSKLIAKPTNIVLLSLENEDFNGNPLIHEIEFKYWEKFMKMYISSNFIDIKPRF